MQSLITVHSQAWSRANEVFAPGAEKHSIKLLMKRLQATTVKCDRASSAKLSISSTKMPKVSLCNALFLLLYPRRFDMTY